MTTSSRTPRWLELDGAPPIPGLRTRFFMDASDYERLSALMIEAHTLDDIPWLPTAQNLQVEMDATEGADPVNDIVIVEVDGRVIAASGVERGLRDQVPTYEVWGAVDPAFRHRGLGTALMGWSLGHARVRASREDPGTPVNVGTFARDTETAHRALIAAAGLEPARHFFLMRRDGFAGIPDAPLPDGLEIRAVTEDQHRAIFEAENEAFRDHWGHRELSEGDYASTYGRAELDTDLWVVAWDGDQVAGSSRTGSGRRRTTGSASSAAGSSTSASDARGGGAGSPRRSPRPRSSSSKRPGSRKRCSVSIRRTRTGRWGCTRASASWSTAARRPTTGRFGPSAGQANSRPPSRTNSIQARSRPIVGRGTVAREDADLILEPGEAGDRRDHRVRVAAREIDPAPSTCKQRVAAEEQAVVLGEEADRSLGMAGGVEDAQPDLAEPDDATLGELDRRDRRRDLERSEERLRPLQPLTIEGMDRDVRAGVRRDRRVVTDVVPVAVGRHDELEGPAALGQLALDPGQRRRRGVDRDRLP